MTLESEGLRSARGDLSLADFFKVQRRRVDEALDRYLVHSRVEPPVVHEAMRYSVFAGGKRLRPALCIAAAEICGGSWHKVMPTAAALEMIHTYSLIHDDLPAMDDDDYRRGRPTCHKKFGEAVAILAGDGLLTLGFKTIAGNAKIPGVRASAVLRALDVVSDAAGSTGMIGGQVVDLEMEGAKVSKAKRRRKLEYIHRHKTGAMIRASLTAGALLSNASLAKLRALDAYGECIGLAFQIADDVLDIIGDKKLLGKRGSDRDNNKLTFPALYGLKASQRKAEEVVDQAKLFLRPFGHRAHVLNTLADFIIQRKN